MILILKLSFVINLKAVINLILTFIKQKHQGLFKVLRINLNMNFAFIIIIKD